MGESPAAVQALLNTLLEPLASAFHDLICEGEKRSSKMFFGMRDYYSMLKMTKRRFMNPDRLRTGMTSRELNMLVCRNFGGDTSLLTKAVRLFHLRCLRRGASERSPRRRARSPSAASSASSR